MSNPDNKILDTLIEVNGKVDTAVALLSAQNSRISKLEDGREKDRTRIEGLERWRAYLTGGFSLVVLILAKIGIFKS